MSRNLSFRNFEQFRSEMLRNPNGPWTQAVDELAEEMYHTDIHEEFDTLWDKTSEE